MRASVSPAEQRARSSPLRFLPPLWRECPPREILRAARCAFSSSSLRPPSFFSSSIYFARYASRSFSAPCFLSSPPAADIAELSYAPSAFLRLSPRFQPSFPSSLSFRRRLSSFLPWAFFFCFQLFVFWKFRFRLFRDFDFQSTELLWYHIVISSPSSAGHCRQDAFI